MKLTFVVEGGASVSVDVPDGENIWITADDADDPIGSLWLHDERLTLGRFQQDQQWWDAVNGLPTA